jgi:peptide-methionine (R)-S-oxide reductase
MSDKKVTKSDKEWKEILSKQQYNVLRKEGTEQAFTGEYWDTKDDGTYICAGCGNKLFESENKFDSGCGWPSYDQATDENAVETRADNSLLRQRTKVICKKCQGHLGHVFDDGPKETTGLRYCINSAAIKLNKTKID